MAASSTSYLHISGISVDFSKSGKNIESAELRLRDAQRLLGLGVGSDKTFHETFDPPMRLSREKPFSLRLICKRRIRKDKPKDIDFDTEDVFRACGAGQKHEYHKSHDGIAIVLSLGGNTTTGQAEQSASSSEESLELHPTTDKIFEMCPQFRILVIGKSGVGKSSLINKAFGVDTLASSEKRGESKIETEFISKQNDKFVLHDSKGFEPGEGDNLEIVLQFIRQKQTQALKDQLHAVWLCFEIPRAGGRILETGTQEFLKSKRDGELGNIPVVVVLTKYDKFIDRVERALDDSALKASDDDFDKLVKQTAEAERDVFTRRVQEAAGSSIPYATVSTKEGHKEMIAHLIQVTEDRVREHVASEASVMAGVAQRVDPKLNIKISIEIGKRRYWKAIASTAAFKGKTVQACLEVLHIDIIRVWNFHDPHHYLESKEFKASVVDLVNKVEVRKANPIRNMAAGLSTVGAIAGIVSALSGPAAPIVVPIMASLVLAKWVYDTYQLSRVLLHHFIAYIVDLTLILQTLYLISQSQEELTPRAIKLAVKAYDISTIRNDVHIKIQEDDWNLPLRDDEDRNTLAKIVRLLDLFSIDAGEISRLKTKIAHVGSVPDEHW